MINRFLAAAVGFALLAGSAAAATPLRRLYDDPLRYGQLSGAARMLLKQKFAPAGPAPQNATIAPQTAAGNISVNNPAADTTGNDTQSTTTLVLGAGSNIVAAFNDSGSLTGSNNHFTGFAQSTDGGSSFTDHGVLPSSTEGDAGDPMLSVDQTSGTVYLATIGFTTGESIPVFRSTNNGTSFGAPVNGTPGFTGTADFQDKPWIAVDNFPGTGQGNAYLAWRRFPFSGNGDIRMTLSTDGGATWGPNQGVAVYTLALSTDQAQGANVVVGTDHAVYVFWYDQTTGGTRTIKMSKSTDSGATFSVATAVTTLLTAGNNGDLGLNGGFLTNCYPQAAVNPSNGHLYVVYNDDPAGNDKANVYLRKSTDGGVTWSAATLVNGDGTSLDQFHPSLAVTPDGSRVFVTWYDRRNDPSDLLIERYAAIYTVDGSGVLTKDSEFRITTQSFPPAVNQDPDVPTGYMGDYDQSAGDNSNFYTVWGDNRRSDLAHAHEPDALFAKIPITGPGALLDFNGYAIDDSSGNSNGAVDPNECINMSVTLKNNGNGTATGITAALTTSNPAITINQGSSAYADLSPGATGTNSTPFQFVTSAGYACGAKIDFVLTVGTAADGTFQIPFTVTTGLPGAPVQFDDTPGAPIPDVGTLDLPLTVSGIATGINRVKVSLQITHSRDSDLDIYLIGPDFTTVELTTDNGGNGSNYGTACSPQSSRTTLDDAAATSITVASAPFTGTFKPEGRLSDFAGKSGSSANGTWTLRVTDDSGSDTGVINCWSLIITPASCTPGNGPCACPVISISPASLPDASVGVPYSQLLTASGGTGPYIFVLFSGALPPGLSLSADGNITGTPTATGAFNFTISAQDQTGCITPQTFSMNVVCPAITLIPGTLPDGVLGTDYAQGIASSGGTAPYNYSLTAGALPPNLTLSTAGLISGPVVPPAGTFNFTITSTDSHGCTGSHPYSITTACAAISLQPDTLPDGDTSAAYNATLTASGGAGPYTFAVTTGSLPPGLTLSTDGSISGTPLTAGTFPFTVTATDSIGCTGSHAYSITVASCPVISLQPATLPGGDTNSAYNATLTASGGAGPYTFAVTTGSLPSGLTLSTDGLLSGTPSSAGTFPFTVTATDSIGCTGSQDYSITVTSCLFCDDFEDGQLATDWTYIKPAWSESGGTLIGTPGKKKAIAVAVPAFAGCSTCTVEATMRTSGGTGNRVWLLAWYSNKDNTLELLMKQENNAWVLKQRIGGAVRVKAKGSAAILPNTDYHVVIQHNPVLGTFTLQVDGVTLFTLNGSAATGSVGFQVKSTTGFFEDILVH